MLEALAAWLTAAALPFLLSLAREYLAVRRRRAADATAGAERQREAQREADRDAINRAKAIADRDVSGADVDRELGRWLRPG